jgi:hypothetical protein
VILCILVGGQLAPDTRLKTKIYHKGMTILRLAEKKIIHSASKIKNG